MSDSPSEYNDEETLFICDNSSVAHIINEFCMLTYDEQTARCAYLIEYHTDVREDEQPIFVPYSIYREIRNTKDIGRFTENQAKELANFIDTRGSKGATVLNELLALIEILHLEHPNRKIIFVSESTTIEEGKKQKIKATGVTEILNLKQTTDYLKDIPKMQAYIQSKLQNISS